VLLVVGIFLYPLVYAGAAVAVGVVRWNAAATKQASGRASEVSKIKVEILYFGGCPTYRSAEKTLRRVLTEEGIKAEISLVAVNTDEEARRLRFPGSPTIRVDGHDPFPVPERGEWGLGCRIYATPEGLKGSPTAQMFRAALTS
jgi:hypothetical protein